MSLIQHVTYTAAAALVDIEVAEIDWLQNLQCRELPDDQLLIISDGLDVLFMPCDRDPRTEFTKFNADIVISASVWQIPDRHKEYMFPPSVEHDPNTSLDNPDMKQHFEESK